MWEESDSYLMALSKENVKANLLACSASMPSVSALTAKQARLSQFYVGAGGVRVSASVTSVPTPLETQNPLRPARAASPA
jgi:hypothetical protein